MIIRKILILLLTALPLVSCGNSRFLKNIDSPTKKDPARPFVNLGPDVCIAQEDGSYPKDPAVISGSGDDIEFGHYFYGQGGGCIARSLREVWATAMNQPLMIWDEAKEDHADASTPDGFAKLFDVHYYVTKSVLGAPFTVRWAMHWFHSVQTGTVKEPTEILINYHKYSGTDHIAYWQGSIVLRQLADNLTGINLRNQIRADRTGEGEAKSTVSDIIYKLQTGSPDWSQLP